MCTSSDSFCVINCCLATFRQNVGKKTSVCITCQLQFTINASHGSHVHVRQRMANCLQPLPSQVGPPLFVRAVANNILSENKNANNNASSFRDPASLTAATFPRSSSSAPPIAVVLRHVLRLGHAARPMGFAARVPFRTTAALPRRYPAWHRAVPFRHLRSGSC